LRKHTDMWRLVSRRDVHWLRKHFGYCVDTIFKFYRVRYTPYLMKRLESGEDEVATLSVVRGARPLYEAPEIDQLMELETVLDYYKGPRYVTATLEPAKDQESAEQVQPGSATGEQAGDAMGDLPPAGAD